MKKLISTRAIALLSLMGVLYSCSKEEHQFSDDSIVTHIESKEALYFMAELSPQQKENLAKTGDVFLPEQQKNLWENIIQKDIPTNWGVFELPVQVQTRASGIFGAYPAQYWTMIRMKTGNISPRIRRALNDAVKEIESKTNVRFYNSQKDPEFYEPYHIKLPNVFVRFTKANKTGSGSFGLVGGEQYIDVPEELDDKSKHSEEEIIRFLTHALCNAAGMFNEQQRKDRDDYVNIHWGNIKDGCDKIFEKQTKNYTMLGNFDYHSITLASSKAYSKNGQNTITKNGGGEIARNNTLSTLDINFLNQHYLPLLPRKDVYTELDTVVYKDGRKLSDSERMELQRNLNRARGLQGDPPAIDRIKREPW